MQARFPENETARMARLALYQLLDTAGEQVYDDITKLATFVAQTPIALISLVDADRQWFKSKIGLSVSETPREHSFCAHAILDPSHPLNVPDATTDKRFADNPLVTSGPEIRFYYGLPLVAEDGSALGTLCVIDQKPRLLSLEQVTALAALSRQVVFLLEMRLCAMQLAEEIEVLRSLPAEKLANMIEIERLTAKLQSMLIHKNNDTCDALPRVREL